MLSSAILDKPSIVKYYGEKLISNYPKNLIEYEQKKLIDNVKCIQSIWSYASFDIIKNNIEMLEVLNLNFNDLIIEWIRSNIKLESFMNMLHKHYEKVGCLEFNTYSNDVFSQLEKLLRKSVVVSKPKRWRMVEFHDHISYQYICNTTDNQPIETIVSPKKIGNYTIKQPKDTLDIIMWGKKVKNCVASYEERIGNSIWIFFIEENEYPLYTVETDKKFNIKQIVGQSNSSVDEKGVELSKKLIMEATK